MASSLNPYVRADLIPEYIDTKLIDPCSWNAREQGNYFESLYESIRTKGLLQPIIVRIYGQRFQVVAGNRRLEACRRLHWVRIPCLVRDLDDREAYEIGLVENIERSSLTPLEEARAFQKYVQENSWGSVTSLAKTIGRSKEYVSHRLALLKLPKDVLTLISTDKIAPSSASELAPINGDPKAQGKLATALAENRVSTSTMRDAVSMYKGGLELDNVLRMLNGRDGAEFRKKAEAETTKRNYLRLLNKSILAIRICMVRLDSIIEEVDSEVDEDNLKELLIKKRLLMHNQIDELIHLKRLNTRNLGK